MNTEWVSSNLSEAIEELQTILDVLGEAESRDDLDVAFAHAYYHVNAAYNGAEGENPYEMPEGIDPFPLRHFPQKLTPVYGSWTPDEP